ncbi:MAG TPA: bifunctional 4-hydroxy-2-oxoglutarate aldolase/2-dehydro-3-deoxy-phosphogluconate aldolase [Propioniciclava sp.]|jgi:2-dehydro-3-deoxyphosphogluconate aldolase/(4S)-4-hydroxy-2-oxoglutarate aldolase|nr:bifunctional 4-hydroxy-2-oxoglutarate aldolase/2-dehydro-3-deoxy-phosphogluconate aldolase [Propioniciclava sp.]HRL79066.1 bifunctional 4-hydroxy-2-oxoglutarate aldolase/2-dehydro-3-deoxy-phosphogluconate aldolase [Propioniciclava sp.]
MDARLSPIVAHSLIPVVVIDDADSAPGLADALVAGGLPVAEVTFRTPAAADAIARMSANSEIVLGAGTVRTAEQVDQAVDAGATYIVSAGLSAAVVRRAQERGVPVLPGTVTATEILAAMELGLDAVKFFPAETSGGVAAIKALAAPFPDITFVPTGGVSPKNLADYLAVKSIAACGGSWMCPRDAVKAGDFATIERLSREAVALVASLKEA